MLCLLYNAWVIPLRASFTLYQTPASRPHWLLADYLADALYWADLLFIKPRIMFLNQGILRNICCNKCRSLEKKKLYFIIMDFDIIIIFPINPDGIYMTKRGDCARNYVQNGDFKQDLFSVIPFEVLYFYFGVSGRSALLRLNRATRLYAFGRAFDRLDAGARYPTVVRMIRTISIMILLMHINACSYYLFSSWEGIGSNSFVYNGIGNAYVKCFYFATKTAISIGKNPKPAADNSAQMLFMAVSWLFGVFVFAVLIGNVKEIIAQSTRTQDEYMKTFDNIIQYMVRMKVPPDTMRRVKTWCQFTWNAQVQPDSIRHFSCASHFAEKF